MPKSRRVDFIHEVVEELGLGAIRKKYIKRKAGRTGTHRDASSFSGFNASKTVSVNKEELLTSSNIHEMDRLGDDAKKLGPIFKPLGAPLVGA